MSDPTDTAETGQMLRIGPIKTLAVLGAAHGLAAPTMEAVIGIDLDGISDHRHVGGRLSKLHLDFAGTEVAPPASLWKAFPADEASKAVIAQSLVLVSVWLQQSALQPVSGGYVITFAGAGEPVIAVPYFSRRCALAALRMATDIIEDLVSNSDPSDTRERTRKRIGDFKKRFSGNGVGRDNYFLVRAARQLDIPCLHLSALLFQFGYGASARRLNGLITDRNSVMAGQVSGNYGMREEILAHAGIPIAGGTVVRDPEAAVNRARKAKYPVAMRPADRTQGDIIVTDIRSDDDVRRAFSRIAGANGKAVVEQHFQGHRYRYLVAAGKAVSVIRLKQTGVTGDGVHTIAELVELANRVSVRPGRLELDFNDWSDFMLTSLGLHRDSVPAPGTFVSLASPSGVARESSFSVRTPDSHADNDTAAERAANLASLETAFVDLVTPDVSKSWRDVDARVIDITPVNETIPEIYHALDRDLYKTALRSILGNGNGRIPIVAVTGTNGKSTVCQMVHRILLADGRRSGVATTQGVWIGPNAIGTKKIDKAGFPGGRMLLLDPTVEAAVIEMPRRGLLNMGFPFDSCTAAALINVQDDHIGEDGIDGLDMLTSVKSRVVERASKTVVVNADDPRCLSVLANCKAREAFLVSANKANSAVADHLASGGTALVLDNDQDRPAIEIRTPFGVSETFFIDEIPATDGGRIRFNVENAMFAIGLAHSIGVPGSAIRDGLKGFQSHFETNPGRLNPVPDLPYRMLVDFAHNNDAIRLLCDYVRQVDCAGRKIVVNYNGGRFRRYIPHWASEYAGTFDLFVIGMDKKSVETSNDYKGMSYRAACEEFAGLLRENGVVDDRIVLEPDLRAGIARVLEMARPDDLVIAIGEPYELWPVISELK